MSGIRDIEKLIAGISPLLHEEEFVFCTFENKRYGDRKDLEPVASFLEKEGLTLVIPRKNADQHHLFYEGVFRLITLQIHSSLEAVGLTAAVSSQLARAGIGANIVAAFYHDHVFVSADKADVAMKTLQALAGDK